MIKTKVEVYDQEKKIHGVSLLVENNEVVVVIIDLNMVAKNEQPDVYCGSSVYLGKTCITFYNLPFNECLISGETSRYTLVVTMINHDILDRIINSEYRLYQQELNNE